MAVKQSDSRLSVSSLNKMPDVDLKHPLSSFKRANSGHPHRFESRKHNCLEMEAEYVEALLAYGRKKMRHH